jgi:hypothetical protein
MDNELLRDMIRLMYELRASTVRDEERIRRTKVLLERTERLYADLAMRRGDRGAVVEAETWLSEGGAALRSKVQRILSF